MAGRTLVQLGAIASCLQLATASPLGLDLGLFSFDFGSILDHLGANHDSSKASKPNTDKNADSASRTMSSSSSGTATATVSTASAGIDGYCENTATTRQCWGGGYYIGTDAETSWPTTGITRSYTLEITNTTLAPDGTERPVFAINGQYPGPTIEADWGDIVSVTVINSLQTNGTSIHWHGVNQYGTNQMDGVNGVTECPLAPGDSKTYTWQATQYGTSWYHSHHSNQYGDGVLGPIVINGPATANYDIDLGAFPVTDWYYTSATDVGIAQMVVGIPWKADTGLINGTMVNSNGGGAYAKTTLQSGKTHRLRLINTSVDNHFKVSLDGHNMTIIQADFVAIEPLEVNWLFIAIGQRYDVLITADQDVDNYWFRAEPQEDCGENWSAGTIQSIFSYSGASGSNPTTNATTYVEGCTDQTGMIPWWKKDVPQSAFEANYKALDVLMSAGTNASWAHNTTVVQWSLDGNLMTIDWSKPTLGYVFNNTYAASDFTNEQNVIELTGSDEWSFWVIQSLAGTITSAPHPIHLHGHDFYVLGAGDGTFSDPSSLTYSLPIRRDVAMLPAVGFLVIAFKTNNPGAWLMHCHIAWHVGEGLSLQFLEQPAQIAKTFSLDSDYDRTCANWATYYETAPYKMFESGL